MADRLFQLEQEQQRLKAQAQQGLSAAQAYEDTPQKNRFLALEQSLDLSKQLGYSLSEVESELMDEEGDHRNNSVMAMQMGEIELGQNNPKPSEIIRILGNWNQANPQDKTTVILTINQALAQEQGNPTINSVHNINVENSSVPDSWKIKDNTTQKLYLVSIVGNKLQAKTSLSHQPSSGLNPAAKPFQPGLNPAAKPFQPGSNLLASALQRWPIKVPNYERFQAILTNPGSLQWPQESLPFVLNPQDSAQVAEWVMQNAICRHGFWQGNFARFLGDLFRQVMTWKGPNSNDVPLPLNKLGNIYQAKSFWLGFEKKALPQLQFAAEFRSINPKSINTQFDSENPPQYNGTDALILLFPQYPDLYTLLLNKGILDGRDNQKDAALAEGIRQIIAQNLTTEPANDEKAELSYITCLLMFGSETLRCRRWYCISLMILDLISAGKISWKQVFGPRQVGQQHYYPPSTNSAVNNSKSPQNSSLQTIEEENAVINLWLKLMSEGQQYGRSWVISTIQARLSSIVRMPK